MVNLNKTLDESSKEFAGINERFQSEPQSVQTLRIRFAEIYESLQSIEWDVRLKDIAITHLETSLMFAIKSIYNK